MEKGQMIKVIVAVVLLVIAVVLIANSLGVFSGGAPSGAGEGEQEQTEFQDLSG